MEIFYLWNEFSNIFHLYQTLSNFLGEFYKIDSGILIALINESQLPVKKSLDEISLIHSGFVSVMSPVTDGNK